MTFQQLLPIAFERSNQLQIYWSFYATIVLGVLAFFGSAKATTRSVRLAVLVTIAFLGVAAANLEALYDVTRQRLAIQPLLISLGSGNSYLLAIAKVITPSSVRAVVSFHLLFDALTIVAIWLLTLRPDPYPPTTNHEP